MQLKYSAISLYETVKHNGTNGLEHCYIGQEDKWSSEARTLLYRVVWEQHTR